jgi:YVTN family beta-propeller protein
MSGALVSGQSPGFFAITPNGRFIYVTATSSGTVTVISTATGKVVKTIAIPLAENMVITPDGKTACVADRASNAIIPIQTATNRRDSPSARGKTR